MINGNVAMADGHNNTEEDMEDGEDDVQTQLKTQFALDEACAIEILCNEPDVMHSCEFLNFIGCGSVSPTAVLESLLYQFTPYTRSCQ